MIAALVLVVSTACIIALRWRVSAPRTVVRCRQGAHRLSSQVGAGVAVRSALGAAGSPSTGFGWWWTRTTPSCRSVPRLALIQPELPAPQLDGMLVLRFCGKESAAGNLPSISVSVVRETAPAATVVRVWEDRVDTVDQGDAAAAWLPKRSVWMARLVRMGRGIRPCSRKYAPRNSHTGFSDGFPLLLASEASLAELNQRLHARGKPPSRWTASDRISSWRFYWRTPNPVDCKSARVKLLLEEDSWSSIRVNGIAPWGGVRV